MGQLTSAHVCPHGSSVIGELAGEEYEAFQQTRSGMEHLWGKVKKEEPDTVIIATPHGLRLKGYHGIYTCAYSSGSLEQNGESVELSYIINQDFANQLAGNLEQANLPIVRCNFGALEGPLSNIPLDWGTFIPLWFNTMEKQPKLVVICPTRDVPLEQHVRLGEILKETIAQRNEKVVFIASADQGHCFDEAGPYGHHPASKEYDQQVQEIVQSNQLEKLLDVDSTVVEDGKPDSLWQMLILHGLIKQESFEPTIFSYEVPTYFGMMVASFR